MTTSRLQQLDFQLDGVRLAVHCSGTTGAPLLLIHSVNAAASAAEVEPLRARYAASCQVFCLDLPGFGHSDRPDRPYTPRLMTDAISAVARRIIDTTGQAADALAASLSCEFLARAARENPLLFRSLALVSPTGFSGHRVLRAALGETRGKSWMYALLRRPGWDTFLFRQLTRPRVIRYFLERTWGSKAIDEDLWRADVSMARYPGARFAPLYFLAGMLFSADVQDVYDSIRVPVWVSHGTRGDFVDYRQLPAFVDRNGWTRSVYATGALCYFETLESFSAAYDHFLSDVAASQSTTGRR